MTGFGNYYRKKRKDELTPGATASTPRGSGAVSGIKVNTGYQQSIRGQMAANSRAWHEAGTQEEKDALHRKNVELSKQLGSGVTYDGSSGKWSGTASEPGWRKDAPDYTSGYLTRSDRPTSEITDKSQSSRYDYPSYGDTAASSSIGYYKDSQKATTAEDPLKRFRSEEYFAPAVKDYEKLPPHIRKQLDEFPKWQQQQKRNDPGITNEFLGAEEQKKLYEQAEKELKALDAALSAHGVPYDHMGRLKILSEQMYTDAETARMKAYADTMMQSLPSAYKSYTAGDILASRGSRDYKYGKGAGGTASYRDVYSIEIQERQADYDLEKAHKAMKKAEKELEEFRARYTLRHTNGTESMRDPSKTAVYYSLLNANDAAKAAYDKATKQYLGVQKFSEMLDGFGKEPYFKQAVETYRKLPGNVRAKLDRLSELEISISNMESGLILSGTSEFERYNNLKNELNALDALLAGQNLSKREIVHIKELSRQINNAQLNERMTNKVANTVGPVSGMAATAASIPLVPVTGLEYLVKVFKQLGDQFIPEDERVPADAYGSGSTAYNLRRAIVDETANAIARTPLGEEGASIYRGVTGVLDSAAMAALGPAFVALQDLGEGNDAYYEAKERGATEDQALLVGGLEGLAGIVFDAVPLKKILKSDPSKLLDSLPQSTWNIIQKRVGKASAREAVSLVIDLLTTKNKNRLNKMYQDYKRQGLEDKDAENEVFLDILEEVFWGSMG